MNFARTHSEELQQLSALRQGDPKALRAIFDQHYPPLAKALRRYISDQETCKDIVQDVFVEIWNKRASIEIHTTLYGYLWQATLNKGLNYINTSRRIVLNEPDDWAEEEDNSEQEIANKLAKENLEQALREAIEQLPEKCRLVFSLSRFEHLSHREISEQLGISTKTIENQITKAMKVLRAILTSRPELSAIVIFTLKYWL